MIYDRTPQARPVSRGLVGDDTAVGAVPLGELVGSQAQVMLGQPTSESSQSMVVYGASGSGKTVMIVNALVSQFVWQCRHLAPVQQSTLVMVDPKSELVTRTLQAICHMAPELLNRVHFLNPFAGGFGLNLCRLPHLIPPEITAAQFVALINSLSTGSGSGQSGLGARQVQLLQAIVLGVLTVPAVHRPTMLWVLDALRDPDGLPKLGRLTTSARAKDVLLSGLEISEEIRASCASRVGSAISPYDGVERIFACDHAIDVAALTAPGQVVLADVGAPPAGSVALTRLFCDLLARSFGEVALGRGSPGPASHLRLVMDEIQEMASAVEALALRTLTLGRAKNVSLLACSQGSTLVGAQSPELVRVLNGNATRVVGRVDPQDAAGFAAGTAPGLGVDTPVGQFRSRVQQVLTNLPNRNFVRFTPGRVDHYVSSEADISGWEQAAEQCAAELAVVRARHALPDTLPQRTRLQDAAPAPRASQTQRRREPRGRFG